MEMIKLPGMNRELAPPRDWDAAKDGECGTLPVFAEVVNGGMTMTSAWKPSEEELDELVKGGVVAMVIYGTVHPPIALGVFPADVVVGAVALTGEGGDVPVVGDEMVAKAYRVCEDFIEAHGDGYINDLDDGQWNEMLRAALTAALGKETQG